MVSKPQKQLKGANSKYWDDYSNLQDTKQKLIKYYLQGWFPKLAFGQLSRVLYFDTHAGKGTYAQGQLGSPLTALNTLIEHNSRDKLLSNCEVVFYFIEETKENFDSLTIQLDKLNLPPNIKIHKYCGNCFQIMNECVKSMKEKNAKMAPSFIFIDPFGFKIPGELLKNLLSFRGVELFVNIIWRELDMAMRGEHGEAMEQTVSEIFCGEEWRKVVCSDDFNERAEQSVNLLKEKLGAKWGTYIRMRGDNGVTRYLLLHLTNHDAGRDLMKDCIWKVCPDGGFDARKSDSIYQYQLITPEPNLRELESWVIDKLSKQPMRWKELIEELRFELWRVPHLTKVLGRMRSEKTISATDYGGRFSQSTNPLLTLIV
ncbi:MAG TPA: three-Cys-motif partner protein TcmP [Oligoflexia bacterium]|nr:three-Cys-motif partner protein TcmP [Oligoflexia bacterium]HMP49435.1 three-Cys-motif partner protein TcmP [Oligoflexia bacterium]